MLKSVFGSHAIPTLLNYFEHYCFKIKHALSNDPIRSLFSRVVTVGIRTKSYWFCRLTYYVSPGDP